MKALSILLVIGLVAFALIGCGGGGGSNCLSLCNHCETSIECCNGGGGGSVACVVFIDGFARCAIPGSTVCP